MSLISQKQFVSDITDNSLPHGVQPPSSQQLSNVKSTVDKSIMTQDDQLICRKNRVVSQNKTTDNVAKTIEEFQKFSLSLGKIKSSPQVVPLPIELSSPCILPLKLMSAKEEVDQILQEMIKNGMNPTIAHSELPDLIKDILKGTDPKNKERLVKLLVTFFSQLQTCSCIKSYLTLFLHLIKINPCPIETLKDDYLVLVDAFQRNCFLSLSKDKPDLSKLFLSFFKNTTSKQENHQLFLNLKPVLSCDSKISLLIIADKICSNKNDNKDRLTILTFFLNHFKEITLEEVIKLSQLVQPLTPALFFNLSAYASKVIAKFSTTGEKLDLIKHLLAIPKQRREDSFYDISMFLDHCAKDYNAQQITAFLIDLQTP